MHLNVMEDKKAIEKLSPSGRFPEGRQKQIEQLTKEKEEFLAGWQRAKADLANYKKEEKERTQGLAEYIKQGFLSSFLSMVDNLERAEGELKEEEKESKVVEGFLLIGKQLREFLKSQGVEEIEAKEKDFDPQLHEAVATIEGEQSGKVVEVLEKGYVVGGKLLRAAKVKVTR